MSKTFSFFSDAFNLVFVSGNIEQTRKVIVVDSVFGMLDCFKPCNVTVDVALTRHTDSTMHFVERVGNVIGQIICDRHHADGFTQLIDHFILYGINKFQMRLLAVGTAIVIVLSFFASGLDRFEFRIVSNIATAFALDPVSEQRHLLIFAITLLLESFLHTVEQIRRHYQLMLAIVPILTPKEFAAIK